MFYTVLITIALTMIVWCLLAHIAEVRHNPYYRKTR